MNLNFTKMSGSGNDFVIIDNRESVVPANEKREFVRKICARRTSVGADGFIFIEDSDKADFKWDFYNEDGSSAEMCGNGGRCVARYAVENGIASKALSFETTAGLISAEVEGAIVKIKLTSPINLRAGVVLDLDGEKFTVDSLNTGVPHAVVYTDRIEDIDLPRIGRGIRYHEAFAPAGTNVCFVQVKSDGSLVVRTYERGVEGETLACGTGVVASSLLASRRNELKSPISALTRGGEVLKVYYDADQENFGDVYLEGLTKISFTGVLGEL